MDSEGARGLVAVLSGGEMVTGEPRRGHDN